MPSRDSLSDRLSLPLGAVVAMTPRGRLMKWTRILAYITGTVDQELLLRNEYLAAENRILMAKLNGRLRFSDAERSTLGEIAFRLGRRALSEVATAAQPDTILACTDDSLLASSTDRGRDGFPADRELTRTSRN